MDEILAHYSWNLDEENEHYIFSVSKLVSRSSFKLNGRMTN